jgi:hypothetical protein
MHYAVPVVLRGSALSSEIVVLENAFGHLYQYNLRPLTAASLSRMIQVNDVIDRDDLQLLTLGRLCGDGSAADFVRQPIDQG